MYNITVHKKIKIGSSLVQRTWQMAQDVTQPPKSSHPWVYRLCQAPEDTPGVLWPCQLTTPLLCWRYFCQSDLYNASQALFKLWFVYVCSVLVQSLIFLGLLSLKMNRFVLIVFVVTHPSAVFYLIINICCYFHQITDSDAYWFVSICTISITQCLK